MGTGSDLCPPEGWPRTMTSSGGGGAWAFSWLRPPLRLGLWPGLPPAWACGVGGGARIPAALLGGMRGSGSCLSEDANELKAPASSTPQGDAGRTPGDAGRAACAATAARAALRR